MKYFLDTEFIEGFNKPLFEKRRHFIDLISIGITCEDGRRIYCKCFKFNDMIKASEQRIGNWILWHGEYHRVSGIQRFDDGDRLYTHPALFCNVNEYEPIPLTPEILEKAGFTHRQESFFHYYLKTYTRVLVESKFEMSYLDEETYAWIEGNAIVHINYVHQLQNLYFALTGEELKIEL